MKSLSRVFLALLLLSAPLWAAGAATTVAVNAKSDRVDIQLQSDSPMTFKEKMLSPSVLAIEVTPATLKPGTVKKMAVDKGLIQTVNLEQRGNSVTVKLTVISRPKLLKSNLEAGGRKLTLSYSTADIASSKPAGFASVAPGKPSRPATAPRTGPAVPAIRPSSPTVTSSSSTVPVRPLTPSTNTVPVAPVASNPGTGGPLISLTFSNASLDDVFAKIAAEAGLAVDISPDVEGNYSGSFANKPLTDVLREVAAGRNLLCYVVNGTLKVSVMDGGVSTNPADPSVPPTIDSTPTVAPVASVPDPVLPAGPLSREYYPIRTGQARDVMAQVRTVVPNVRYTVDDRLNIIMAEGSAADIDRLTKILQSSSAK